MLIFQLGEAIYAPSYFNPYTSFIYFVPQLVFFDDVLGEDHNWHLHVFKLLHRHAKVNVFYNKAHIFCTLCAQYTACCQFPRIYDEISSRGDADLVGVFFSVVDNPRLCLRMLPPYHLVSDESDRGAV